MPQTPLKIVALSGGLQRPSRPLVLVEELIAFVRAPERRRQLVRPGRMAAPELGGVDEGDGEGAEAAAAPKPKIMGTNSNSRRAPMP
jgi:hypothetical protein